LVSSISIADREEVPAGILASIGEKGLDLTMAQRRREKSFPFGGNAVAQCGGFDIRFAISASPPGQYQIQNRTRIISLPVPLWF
jgi:hypothetical protein